jgi:hypothetical protein
MRRLCRRAPRRLSGGVGVGVLPMPLYVIGAMYRPAGDGLAHPRSSVQRVQV